jgi:hypothetical protein
MEHLRKNAASYAPALAPFLLLFFGVLCALLFPDRKIAGILATHAIYGFLFFLILSYLLFRFLARPLAGLAEHLSLLSQGSALDLSVGTIYGAVMATCLVSFLRITWQAAIVLFLSGMVAGNLNWLFYRRLVKKSR